MIFDKKYKNINLIFIKIIFKDLIIFTLSIIFNQINKKFKANVIIANNIIDILYLFFITFFILFLY